MCEWHSRRGLGYESGSCGNLKKFKANLIIKKIVGEILPRKYVFLKNIFPKLENIDLKQGFQPSIGMRIN